MTDDCIEDGTSWYKKELSAEKVIPALVSTVLAALLIGGITYYGFLEGFAEASIEKHKSLESKITAVNCALDDKIKDTVKSVDQETKRNNIQDINIAKNSEKLANVQLSLNRIENTLGILTGDLKEFMKETPKEMRSMRKEITDLGKSVAILRDRDERGEE